MAEYERAVGRELAKEIREEVVAKTRAFAGDLMRYVADKLGAPCDENGNIHCDSQKASRFLHAMFCISEDEIEWATNLKEWAYAEAEKAGLFLLCEELKPFPDLKAQKRSDDK